ncbi:MAG: hypothetical protein ACP5R2_01665 [Anaerolineae bacterium]
MMTYATLVFTAGGTLAVLIWLIAFGLRMRYVLCPAEASVHLPTIEIFTRIGLLLGTVSWGSYAALTWPQLLWRVALLPPVALAALMVQTSSARRGSMPLVVLCLHSCAVVAYGVALAPLWIGGGAGMLTTPPALPLAAVREIAAATAAGALLAHGLLLPVRCYLAQPPNDSLVEHLGDGTVRVAWVAVTLALAAAAWRAWSAWGEVARADVTVLFIAWSLLTAAYLRQMVTGITMARMIYGLALLALALVLMMLAFIP